MKRRKEDSLHFIAPYLQNDSSLLPLLPGLEASVDRVDGEQFLQDPWLDMEDTSVPDQQDSWIDEEDPLEVRHLPNSAEAAPIEEEDILRAIAQSETSAIKSAPVLSPLPSPPPLPSQTIRRPRIWLSGRKRIYFIAAAGILAMLLILNGLLILFNISSHHTASNGGQVPNTHPLLTVTPTVAHPGQVVIVHISNFSSSAHVLLTRDIQQTVRTDTGSSLIKLGAGGNADVGLLVQDNWGRGNHMLLAEDTHTHFTASVFLQVISDFPAPLPHLVVGSPDQPNGLTASLQMGAQLQGANTIQSLLLRNTGGSWIAWKATSNQPWLLMAPSQGIFQESQSMFIAAARAHLKPGDYQGAITITSNTGSSVIIKVMMTVLPLPKITTAFMVIVPPLLSFTTTDGAMHPSSQQLDIRNAGVEPLNWSVAVNAPENLNDQNVYGQNDVYWLSANATSGTIAPGAAVNLQVIARTSNLLPGVYSGLLLVNVNGNALNAPQSVAIALTVLPRCGVATSQADVSFMLAAGQHSSISQPLTLSTTPGCADVTNWQSFPLANWLSITPASGQLQPGVGTSTTLLVDGSKLAPGTYRGWIDLLTELRSQTLLVQVTVASSASTTGVSPGASSPGSSNTPVPGGPSSTVVSGDPTVGPTTTAAPGSPTPTPTPQPCVWQVKPANLTFVASLLQPNPPGQQLMLTATGNCVQPVAWTASVDANSQNWLHLSTASGTLGSNGSTIVVNVNANGKLLGSYTGQITLTALEQGGVMAQGSPQYVSVTLTVIL